MTLFELPESADKKAIKAALTEIFGQPAPKQHALYQRVTNYLHSLEATPDEIRRRAMCIVELWGVKALSLPSLEKHWSRWDGLAGKLSEGDVEVWQRERRFEAKRNRLRKEWERDG